MASNVTKTFTYEGKRYYVRAKTEKEAYEKMALKKLELKSADQVYDPGLVTVEEWANKCIETYKTNLSDKALRTCKDIVRLYICSKIGSMKLKNVKQIHCQETINGVAHMSQYVIDQTAQKMRWIFRKAVENGMLQSNPADYIVKPKGYRSERRALTKEEQELFLKCAKRHHHGLLFFLIYGCGCRPSEAARVRMSDFFKRDDRLYLHICGTKSKAADRVVPVPDFVKETLPKKLGSSDYAVTTSRGNPLSEKAQRRAWLSLCRDMNIELGCKVYRNQLVPPLPLADDISPYSLRHTYCTNLQKKGVDIRTAQVLMGHSDISLTANIYTHIDFDSLAMEWDKINGVAPTVALEGSTP